ncbi:MAG: hypothetical protein KGL66_08885, partial [Alphaproteobacteria bacterium]|nr:hypothetical protein [Alphaproteobacteria bacterium]
ICTALQITYIALILLLLLAGRQMPDLVTAAELITAAITLASGLNYAALWLRALIVRAGRTA